MRNAFIMHGYIAANVRCEKTRILMIRFVSNLGTFGLVFLRSTPLSRTLVADSFGVRNRVRSDKVQGAICALLCPHSTQNAGIIGNITL